MKNANSPMTHLGFAALLGAAITYNVVISRAVGICRCGLDWRTDPAVCHH